MITKAAYTLSLGLILCSLASAATVGDYISVKNAWVNEAPPGARVLAAYVSLENNGNSSIFLNKVDSPDFELIELHESVVVNGVAEMRKHETILIKENEIVEFQPGGLHLMLINPNIRKKQGDKVSLNFHFSDKSLITIQAPVKKTVGKGQMHHQHRHQ